MSDGGAGADGIPAVINGVERHFPRGTLVRVNEWYGCTGKPNEGLKMTATNVAPGILERDEPWALASSPALLIRPSMP